MANQDNDRRDNRPRATNDDGIAALRESPMMAHLLDALEEGTDIGHYGRLTFVMVARHFMDEDRLVKSLASQPGESEESARALVEQVQARDYNPPKRDQILEWQAQQDFPICPTPDEPGSCNVYSDLRFPEGIYDNINEFWVEQSEAGQA